MASSAQRKVIAAALTRELYNMQKEGRTYDDSKYQKLIEDLK